MNISSQQAGFFAARAFALQIGLNLGRDTAKVRYALLPHRAASFSPLSGEAYPADGVNDVLFLLIALYGRWFSLRITALP